MNQSFSRLAAQSALGISLLAASFGALAAEISVRDQQYTVALFDFAVPGATLDPFVNEFTPVTGKDFDADSLNNFGNTKPTGASMQYAPETDLNAGSPNKFGQVASYYNTGVSYYAFVTDAKNTNATNVDNLHFTNFDLTAAKANNKEPMNINPDTYFQGASSINDQGQFFAIGGGNRYLISPVPEPTTVVLMLAGLGLVGAAARRQLKSKNRLTALAV
jgi:hypothetical protein